jgi:hypothetical protein
MSLSMERLEEFLERSDALVEQLTSKNKALEAALAQYETSSSRAAQRPWVGLVNKDKVLDFGDAHVTPEFARGALWAEAKLKEMNT